MFKKLAAIITFGAGCYYGYQHTAVYLEMHAADFEGYWGNIWSQGIQIIVPLAVGAIGGTVVYFVLNLFARAD